MHSTGAITSTANDMVRWMTMLLCEGQNEAGEEVFSSDIIFETRTPVNAYSANPENLYRPPSCVNHIFYHFKIHCIGSFSHCITAISNFFCSVPVTYEYWSSYGLGVGTGS